jgi:hypothetical protein
MSVRSRSVLVGRALLLIMRYRAIVDVLIHHTLSLFQPVQNQAVEKMFWLEPGPLQAPTRNIVYLTRPSRSHLEIIADQIKTHQSQQTQGYVYHVLFAPRRTALAGSILEELGIGGDVEVKELGLGASWIVLEDDLMSLEKEPGVIRDLYLVSLGANIH